MCETVDSDPNNSAFSVVRKGLRFLISSRGRPRLRNLQILKETAPTSCFCCRFSGS